MKSQNPAANLGDSERVEEHAELFHKKQATNQTTNKNGDSGNLNKKKSSIIINLEKKNQQLYKIQQYCLGMHTSQESNFI